jgi:hypothetical protein
MLAQTEGDREMATRSTVTIYGQNKTIHLYRHWDGYPGGTGRHLAYVMRGLAKEETDADKVAGLLLESRHDGPACSGTYEVTNHARNHRDSEFHYNIWLFRDGAGFQVKAGSIQLSNTDPRARLSAFEGEGIAGGCAAAFRRFIAGEVCQLRLIRRRRALDTRTA